MKRTAYGRIVKFIQNNCYEKDACVPGGRGVGRSE